MRATRDDDNDGVNDSVDNCPLISNPDQNNTDNDSRGDACDPDDDNDGVLDPSDNCPLTYNPEQYDGNNNSIGDICDPACFCLNCSDCNDKLNGGCKVVSLVANIIDHEKTCINNSANFENKTFDCKGHTIDGDDKDDDYAVFLDKKLGNKIRNCVITDFNLGIRLKESSNSILEDNIINSNSKEGIYLENSPNTTLISNTANSNEKGIRLKESSNSILEDNTMSSNSKEGIYLENSLNNTLQGNHVSSNDIGIFSQGSNSVIAENAVCGNINLDFSSPDWKSSSGDNNTCNRPDAWNDDALSGCRYVCGSCNCDSCSDCSDKLSHSACTVVNLTQNIINHSKTCINDPVNFKSKTFDCKGHTIDGDDRDDDYGIFLDKKSGNKIRNCVITDFNLGIRLKESSNSILEENTAGSNIKEGIYLENSPIAALISNTANSNEKGIRLKESSNSILEDNTVSSNIKEGIYLENSQNSTLQGNHVSSNDIGIFSQGSNSVITENAVCGNINLDFSSSNWLSSYGDNNTCNKPDGWNDDAISGCIYVC